MDLRSVLNTSDNGDRSAARAPQPPPPPPPLQQQHPQQHPHQPRGPPPTNAQYAYHEYPHHSASQRSPGKPGVPEYQHPSGQYPPGAYPPQSPYQAQAAYPPRASHPGSFADPRSPGNAPSVQSPYRHSASSSAGPGHGPAQGYFPNQAPHEIRSPSQRHQYPPAQYHPPPHHAHHQHQRHDSHPPPQGQPTTPYLQHPPIPQTPPIGHPGQQHGQRTHSAQSTPTPTSAHSQHAYGPPFSQGSPVSQHQHPPLEYRRHPSQPPGPPSQPHSANPSSAHSQGPHPFSQPSSPYQQKVPFPGSATVAQAHSSPNGPPHPQQPQHRLSHTRPPSLSAQESPRPGSAKRRSTSDREHSMSVSPKTRVASLPGNAGHRPSISESESRADLSPKLANIMQFKQEQPALTPAKRKLDDRSMSPSELENRNPRPPPGQTNGQASEAPQAAPKEAPQAVTPAESVKDAPIKEEPMNEDTVNEGSINEGIAPDETTPAAKGSATPAAPEQDENVVRVCHSDPPVWALSLRTLGKALPKHANYVLPQRPYTPPPDDAKESHVSRSPIAEESRAPSPPEPQGPQEFLGPWEASITGVKPYEEMSRAVADFLFIHVINAQDAQEISSRGIDFEIEAKLGTLIDKDTNHRIEKFVESECVLRDTGRVAFQSSMTETHHKAFNDFLNNIVIQTDPRSAHGRKRVQVHYKHRREIDKYFELPLDMQARIPGCVRSRLGTRKNVKARVTYDEKTGEVLNKIVKARVADIDLHMPKCPMDCRISINLEMHWDGSVDELEKLPSAPSQGGVTDRRKDRLSYKQGNYQIDLTQVTMPSGQGSHRGDKEHELEIEVSGAAVIEQGRRARSGEAHGYQELVEGFLDNVRVLARKAREFQR
ncbi:mRNA capping enzyme, beta subunit, structural domain protein [Cordyceps fumosorosea ARSEF 2679]|uniref:mRNA-capping enzyme subunit beta n=1 Tax=Cordyceps fumosorosea (strain ARSEF 2679) TaxID=1081104 RepID=A0A162LNN1_CORFA|nr:mRNA capping enzyme, beta subunit, structural domain protein [Cordyceps fumosorosea ARSEF 2679]OAA73384.1 mRNA capping enzyme, beta subunit, structural domain protein [Cordyceps fumosorosea ARSEF 2679]